MPPETLSSRGYHSEGRDPMVDSWALGCVLYFCYHGKPPFYGETAQVLEQMELFFQQQLSSTKTPFASSSAHVHFQEDANGSQMEFSTLKEVENQSCEDLIHILLAQHLQNRLSFAGILESSYLTKGYSLSYEQSVQEQFSSSASLPVLNPRNLYQQDPPAWPTYDKEAAAGGGGSGDDKWARRQFSSLWAPMPAQYNLSGNSTMNLSAVSGNVSFISCILHE
jgi:serine/threonine protein kinase